MFSTYLHFKQPIRLAERPSKGFAVDASFVERVESDGDRGIEEVSRETRLSSPAGLLTMSHCRADSASRVSIRRLKNSWASCCSRVARSRFLSDNMRARATWSGCNAVEKGLGVLR